MAELSRSLRRRSGVKVQKEKRKFISMVKNNTQTAVINIVNLRIMYNLDVSYASQHTFSKVTVTIFIFLTTIKIYDNDKGSGTEIKKKQS